MEPAPEKEPVFLSIDELYHYHGLADHFSLTMDSDFGLSEFPSRLQDVRPDFYDGFHLDRTQKIKG